MAPKDNSTLSSVTASGEFMAKECRGMESMKYTRGQNMKTKRYEYREQGKQEIIQKQFSEKSRWMETLDKGHSN